MCFLGTLAILMEYPEHDYCKSLEQCIALCSPPMPELTDFASRVNRLPISNLQELYVDFFDLHAETSPYLGHHLFGQDVRRNIFMAKLRDQYRGSGLADSPEMPDHLSQLLRYLALQNVPWNEETAELVERCALPAVGHMLQAAGSNQTPFVHLLRSVLVALQQSRNKNLEQS